VNLELTCRAGRARQHELAEARREAFDVLFDGRSSVQG
jgi:hypothetical protein